MSVCGPGTSRLLGPLHLQLLGTVLHLGWIAVVGLETVGSGSSEQLSSGLVNQRGGILDTLVIPGPQPTCTSCIPSTGKHIFRFGSPLITHM